MDQRQQAYPGSSDRYVKEETMSSIQPVETKLKLDVLLYQIS